MPLFGPPNVAELAAKRDVPGLIKALGYKKDHAVRDRAADALGEIGDPRAVEPLIAALFPVGYGTMSAARALAKIGDPRAVDPLIAAFNAPSASHTRGVVLRALAEVRDPRAVEALISALGDRDPDICRQAAEALHRLAWSPDSGEAGAVYWAIRHEWDKCVQIGGPAVGSLIVALEDPNREVRTGAALALGEIGAPAVEPLIAALRDQDRGARAAVAEALGLVGVSAVKPLLDVLTDQDGDVRVAAAGALGRIGDAQAVEPLIAMLSQSDPDACRVAARALGELRDPRAVEALIGALEKGEWAVRTIAAEALGKIGDSRAVAPLIAALRDGAVAAAAAQALTKIGDPQAVEPLIAALAYGYWDVRKAVAEGLVAMYRSGKLDKTQRAALLARRPVIIQSHRDMGRSDCHTDEGIAVGFPI